MWDRTSGVPGVSGVRGGLIGSELAMMAVSRYVIWSSSMQRGQ